MKRLLVIGGGLAGLSAAWYARRAGADVTVLERGPVAGGVVQSFHEKGFLVETGPNTLMLMNPAVRGLVRVLGLNDEIIEPAAVARKRFVVRGGRSVPVPMGLMDFITSPLFSLGGKWRLWREQSVPARAADAGDESVAAFARRRFGPEALAYAFEPFVSGVYAGDPERLSVAQAFPRLVALEREQGSLLRAGRKMMAERRAGASASRTISFRDGLAALPRALAAQIGPPQILTRALLHALAPSEAGGWEAAWERFGHAAHKHFDAVVLALPAHALGDLPLPTALATALQPADKIEYPPVSVVVLGFARGSVGHPLDGFGMLVPAVEKAHILGVLFTSSLFAGRAPPGEVLLTTFVGGARRPEVAALDDAKLYDLVLDDLRKFLEVRGLPVFRTIVRWPRAIPQYGMNHAHILSAFEKTERAWPGLVLTGNYRDGIALPQTLEGGRLAAARALGCDIPPEGP